jgi:hypothetical protein
MKHQITIDTDEPFWPEQAEILDRYFAGEIGSAEACDELKWSTGLWSFNMVQLINEAVKGKSDCKKESVVERFESTTPAFNLGGIQITPKDFIAAIKGLRGKYGHIPTSSEDFAARKTDEAEPEEPSAVTTRRVKLEAGKVRLFARSLETGEVVEIKDLYWFEEQGVRDFHGNSFGGELYEFEVEIKERDC